VRSLFATILAISTSTVGLPAIANSISETTVISRSAKLSASPTTQKENLQISGSNQFAQRSLNLAKQIPTDVVGLLIVDANARSWQAIGEFYTKDPTYPASMIDEFLTLFGEFPQISIVKDIQPWLGKEVALTFWGNPEKIGEFTFAAMSPVADSQKFELFLKKLKSLDLPKPTETLYQNVKILEWQLEEETIGDKKPVLSHRATAHVS
jgi:hypothetical protein